MSHDEFDNIDEDALMQLMNTIGESSQKMTEPGPEHLEVLTKYFGHKRFRPMQWEIISAIINDKRDVCAVMSTGYGKSLCFQYPSTFLGGVTLVVSPLISLMEDQVLSLTVSSIPACLLGTAQTKQRQVIEDIFQNKYSIIYLTPEFCSGEFGADLLTRMSKELNVVLVAIDEAHCISSWGHDFRTHYRKLGALHNIFPHTPVIAVTATATPMVRQDIIGSLKLCNPLEVCSGFDRPNLYFEVHNKSGAGTFKDLTKTMINENSGWKFSGSSIIYCISRRDTEMVANLLKINGIKCLPYHAGLTLKERQEAHEQFVKDKIDVIVATIAFGMGIDKPDIRNVVHYGCSKSIESYYQEVGRAGRDGLPAKCTTIYSAVDFQVIKHLNSQSGGSNARKDTALKKMEEYLITRKCRRRFILEHFEDKVEADDKPQSKCCDNCTKRLYDKRTDQEKYEGIDDNGCYDFTEDARKFLKVVPVFGGLVGLSTYILFIRGSNSSKLNESKQKHHLHGCGSDQSEEWWKCIARILIQQKYLIEKTNRSSKGFTYTYLSLTDKGREFMANNEKLLLSPPSTILKLLRAKPSKEPVWLTAKPPTLQPSSSKQPERIETQEEINARMLIYRKLISQRTEIASKLDCMPYMVASNAALMKMSKFKPQTLDDLRQLNLDGFAEAKINKFGNAFLKVIAENSDIETDIKRETKQTIKDILTLNPLPEVSLPLTAEVSYTMLQSGLTVGEIAQKRGVLTGTITSHLVSGIKCGYPVKLIELGVTEECRDIIINTYRRFHKTGFTNVRLSEMKENCPSEITYDQIKAVLAYLQVRCHLASLNVSYEEFEDFKFNDVDLKLDALISLGNELKDTEETDKTMEENLEPPAKKEKTDFDLITDSPPRLYAPVDSQPVVVEPHKGEDTAENTNAKKSNNKKKVLPPWLTVKKIN